MNRNKLSAGILVLAFLLLAAGAGALYSDYRERQDSEHLYESLAELAEGTKESTTANTVTEGNKEEPYVSPIDFDKLKKINPDVVGWILIEGTNIDYPIVRTDNNDTYLDTDFEGKKNPSGAIFLDCDSEPDFSGRHNIIYGHHMKNGSMFKDIIKYKDESFYQAHQTIVIYTPQQEFHLRPVTVLYTDAGGIRRKTKFDSDASFQSYVDEMTKNGQFYQAPQKPVDTLWSFVTCSYEFDDARTILYAVSAP
ncbi:class B sortase [Lacrimispora amygdalina]|uniref:class B sortase n=1 Tax=Lacrimispora amygdalina TaxID=253257 RepID=UPI000BE48090|nr:class B sortase [Lacrimispora amygdalina]